MFRHHSAVWALALAAFAIGIAEFVVVGILPSIAADFGITIDHAGYLVSGYALALAIGTPLKALLLSKFSPRRVLVSLMVLFAMGNLVAVFATEFYILMIGRVFTAVAHGATFALGATVASRLAPEGKSGDALALMFSGLTLAMVIGVPLGSVIGNAMGWRIPFVVILVLAVVSLVALWSLIPRTMKALPTGSIGEQLAALKNPAILIAMAMTATGFGATFPLFTFINAWLTDLVGFTDNIASWLLMLFGLATLIGNLIGGRTVVNKGWERTIQIKMTVLFTILMLIYLFGQSATIIPILIALWGAVAFGVIPAFQSGMMTTAEESEPQAVGFASSLNISAFNIGISLGAVIGSIQVAAGDLSMTPVSGAVLAVLTLILLAAYKVVTKSDRYSIR